MALPSKKSAKHKLFNGLHIVDDILAKEDNDMIYKSNTRYFVSQAKRNLEEIIEESKDQGTSSNRKTIIHAKEGLFSIKQIQKDLEDNDRSEGESDNPKQYTTEDDVFIETLRKPGKRRKWREIFGKGNFAGQLLTPLPSTPEIESSSSNSDLPFDLDLCPFSSDQIHEMLKQLPRKKAPGVDHIQTEMLSPLIPTLVP